MIVGVQKPEAPLIKQTDFSSVTFSFGCIEIHTWLVFEAVELFPHQSTSIRHHHDHSDAQSSCKWPQPQEVLRIRSVWNKK